MKHKEIRLKEIRDEISHINMSDLITIIGHECFYSNIESIKLSRNLKIIEKWTFYGCINLKSIDFTNCINLREIGESAFRDCHELGRVYIPDKVELGEGIFWNCHSLEDIKLPNDLETISGSLFRNCKSLTSINIPNSVVKIEKYTFHGTGIKEINISKKVIFNSIGQGNIKINYIDLNYEA